MLSLMFYAAHNEQVEMWIDVSDMKPLNHNGISATSRKVQIAKKNQPMSQWNLVEITQEDEDIKSEVELSNTKGKCCDNNLSIAFFRTYVQSSRI